MRTLSQTIVKTKKVGKEAPHEGITDYNELTNKPSIGGITVQGDKTLQDYGAEDMGALTSLDIDAIVEGEYFSKDNNTNG